MKKILLWSAGVIIVVFALGYLAIALFFPDEKLRAYLEENASEQLGQQVSIRGLSATVWGGLGVSLEDITVGEPDDSLKLADISRITARIAFWPLLSGEYEITRLEVIHPSIVVLSNIKPETTNQVSSGGKPGEQDLRPGSETALLLGGLSFGELEAKEIDLRRIALSDSAGMSEARIFNGEFTGNLIPLRDSVYSMRGDFTADSVAYLSDEQPSSPPITIRQFGFEYDALFDSRIAELKVTHGGISLPGVAVEFTGDITNVVSGSPVAEIVFTVSGADLGDLFSAQSDVVKGFPSEASIGGVLEAEGEIRYSGDTFGYDASGAINGLRLKSGESAPAISAQEVSFAMSRDSLRIHSEEIKADEGALALSAAFYDINDSTTSLVAIDLHGTAPLALLERFLPSGGKPQLGGVADVALEVSGDMLNPEGFNIGGSLKIRDGSLRATTLPEQIEHIACDIAFSSDKIDISEFALNFERSNFSLTGEIGDPFPYLLPVSAEIKARSKGPFLTFSAKSQRFDLDKLFPEAAPGTGVNRASMPLDSLPPLVIPEMNGSGTMTFDTLVYSGIDFTEATADVRIERTKIFCENIRGNAYSGNISGHTTIDLTDFANPSYSGDFHANEIEINDFVSRFSPVGGGGYLFGKVKLDGGYSGSGWRPQDFLSSLTMDLSAIGANLSLRNAPLALPLIDELVKNTGKEQLRSKYQNINLSSFQSALKLVNGRLMVEELSGAAATLGAWKLRGGIALDGAIDLRGAFTPARELVAEIAGNQAMADAVIDMVSKSDPDGLSAPLRIGGTIEKPVFVMDNSVVEKRIAEAIKKQSGDYLKDLFKR